MCANTHVYKVCKITGKWPHLFLHSMMDLHQIFFVFFHDLKHAYIYHPSACATTTCVQCSASCLRWRTDRQKTSTMASSKWKPIGSESHLIGKLKALCQKGTSGHKRTFFSLLLSYTGWPNTERISFSWLKLRDILNMKLLQCFRNTKKLI